jgi:hypothetical protein
MKIDKRKYPIIINLYNKGLSLSKIGARYNTSAVTIMNILRKFNIKSRAVGAYRKYNINHNIFNNINTLDKAYFLGWAFSDGYNNLKDGDFHISIQEGDRIVLNKLQKIIETDRPLLFIDRSKLKNKKNLLRLSIRSHKICEDLARLGCVQNKSKTVEMPNIKQSLMPYFLRGYFEGDGCINYYLVKGKKTNYLNTQFYICSGSRKIIEQISNFIKNKLKIKNYITVSKKDVHYMNIYGINNIMIIMDYLYKDNLYLSLDRKVRYLNKLKQLHKNKTLKKWKI